MNEDIFDRVSRLIEQYTGQTKSGSFKKKAADPKLQILEEYDAGKHVDPKSSDYMEEMDALVAEHHPASTTATDPEDLESDDPQVDVEERYPTTPDVEVADEANVPDADVREDPEGEEALEEEKLSSLSDGELLRRFRGALEKVAFYYAAFDPTGQSVKRASLSKTYKAALAIADIVKQAEADAQLVAGFLHSFNQTATEQLTKMAEEAAAEEAVQQAAEQATANLPTAEAATDVDPDALLAAAEEVAKNDQELQEALQDAQVEAAVEILQQADPDEVLEVLEEDPELAGAVASVLGEESPAAPTEDVASAAAEEAAKEAFFKQAMLQKIAEEAMANPEEILNNVSEDEIAEVLEENPELAQVLQVVLSQMEAQEGAEGDESSEPKTIQKLEDVLGTEEHEKDKDRETPTEGGEEEARKDVTEPEGTKTSAFRQLYALSSVMDEVGITPEDLEILARGSSRYNEAVKTANAVRNFRQKINKLGTKGIKASVDNRLREELKNYLAELIS